MAQVSFNKELFEKSINTLRSECFNILSQAEALNSENLALKEQVDALSSPVPSQHVGSFTEEDFRRTSIPGTAETPVEADKNESPEQSPESTRSKSSRNRKGKTTSFGIPDSQAVSLSAARLGMVCERQELVEELENHAGLQHMLTEWMPSHQRIRSKTILQKVARHLAFKLSVICVILANCIYLGYDADLQVKNSYRHLLKQDQVVPDEAIAWIFPVLFVVELLIRIGADGRNFFKGDEKWWNIFDIILVLNSSIEIIFPVADLSVLRILRVFRMVRVIRVVKHVKWLKSLRTMVFALINSFVSLMWAFFMIMLIIFVFSILFCHGVAAHNFAIGADDAAAYAEALAAGEVFGSLWETCVSLFGAVSGGNDWMFYAEFLRSMRQDQHDLTGEIYFAIFAFYVAFCTVGLLNVVTGIFVDSAVTTRTEDEVVDAFKDEMENRQQEVRRIFTEAVGGDEHDMHSPHSHSKHKPSLTYEQLKEQLDNPWVKAYFSGLEIDPNEAAIIFTLMDTDHNGRVTIDEFIDGTMKLKGAAKSVDMLLLMFDHVRFISKFNTLCSYLEDEMRSIKSVIFPGARQSPKMFDCALEAPSAGLM